MPQTQPWAKPKQRCWVDSHMSPYWSSEYPWSFSDFLVIWPDHPRNKTDYVLNYTSHQFICLLLIINKELTLFCIRLNIIWSSFKWNLMKEAIRLDSWDLWEPYPAPGTNVHQCYFQSILFNFLFSLWVVCRSWPINDGPSYASHTYSAKYSEKLFWTPQHS